MAKSKKTPSPWKCNGYGTYHGHRLGRMWFACSACRWSVK